MWQTGLFRKELSFEKHSTIITIKCYIKKKYYRLKKRIKKNRKLKLKYFIN